METIQIGEITWKVGDVMTAYMPGIHRLIKIEPRGDQSPLFYYERILNSNMKPQKASACCDAAYCRHYTLDKLKSESEKAIKDTTEKYERGISYMENYFNIQPI